MEEKIYYDDLSIARRTSQKIHHVNEHDKIQALALLLNTPTLKNVVVLCKTKKTAEAVTKALQTKEINALSIHANKTDDMITTNVNAYNDNTCDVLVATDKIAFAQSLTTIEHIINHNIPFEPKEYYQRLMLLKEAGESVALVSEEEHAYMDLIEWKMKVEILVEEIENFKPTSLVHDETLSKKSNKKPRHRKTKA